MSVRMVGAGGPYTARMRIGIQASYSGGFQETAAEIRDLESVGLDVAAVAEVYTPVAGEIVEINDAVVEDPELLNEEPQSEGWLVKIRFSSAADLKSLMNAEQYEEYVKSGDA